MKSVFTFLTLLAFSHFAFSQASQVWANRYSFSTGTDRAYSMALDDSGNVYVTGSSLSGGAGTEDYTTIKYNTAGIWQWTKRYDGSASGVDIARSIAVDSYGNSYVTGSSASANGFTDCITIKYDTNGDTVWTAHYNGSGNKNDIAYSIAIDDSGNVYIAGSSEGTIGVHGIFEDYITIKYNAAGIQMWANQYNGPGTDFDAAYSVAVDHSGNVIVTGESGGGSVSSSDPYQDYATIKYTLTGALVWTNRYNGPLANSDDKANRVVVDAVGNVIVTGRSEGTTTFDDYLTIKYNATGGLLWTARHDGASNNNDEAKSVAVDSIGNCFVTGFVYNGTIPGKDIETIKYDATGVESWVMPFNGTSGGDDGGEWIEVDDASNAYVTGYTNGTTTAADYITLKYDATGATLWSILYTNSYSAGSSDVPCCLKLDKLGDIYVTGMSALDYATIKYSETSSIAQLSSNKLQYKIMPNPNNGSFQIPYLLENTLVEIFDCKGRKVYSHIAESSGSISYYGNSGIYLLAITDTEAQRIVLKLVIK